MMRVFILCTILLPILFGLVAFVDGQSDRIQPKFPQQPPPTQTINPQEILGEPFLDIKMFSASSNTIDYGQEVTLKWTIKGRNMKNLKLELSPDVGAIPLSRTDYTNEDFTIEGSKKIKPSQTQQYILKVSGIAPGTIGPQRGTGPRGLPGVGEKTYTDSKSLTINVKKVVLENEKPEVDQKTMQIKFIVKNTGNADFRGPILIDYKVKTLSGAELIAGTEGPPSLTINAGEKKVVHLIRIPDRQTALNADGILIHVSILADLYPSKSELVSPPTSVLAEKHAPMRSSKLKEVDNDTYEHRWEVRRLSIKNELINTYGGIVTGSIRLNNFDGSTGKVLKHEPIKRNDCYIEIMGNRLNFDIDRFGFSKSKYDYRGYINDLKANFSGRDSFSIENGALKLTIRFETIGTEIKGYEETLNVFHDLTAPDYNFTKFEVYVYFLFGIVKGRLTYVDLKIKTEIKGEFTGAYDLLLPDSLNDYFLSKVKPKVHKEIRNLLINESVKSTIEGMLEQYIIRDPRYNIYRLVNVKGEGNDIVIEYIEK